MKHKTFLALLFTTLICNSRRKCFSRIIADLIIAQSVVLGAGTAAPAVFDVAAVFLGSFFCSTADFVVLHWGWCCCMLHIYGKGVRSKP